MKGVETALLLPLKYNLELCICFAYELCIWPLRIPCLMYLFLSLCLLSHIGLLSVSSWVPRSCLPRDLGTWQYLLPPVLTSQGFIQLLHFVVCLNISSSDNLLPLTWHTLVIISNCALCVYFIEIYHTLDVCVYVWNNLLQDCPPTKC